RSPGASGRWCAQPAAGWTGPRVPLRVGKGKAARVRGGLGAAGLRSRRAVYRLLLQGPRVHVEVEVFVAAVRVPRAGDEAAVVDGLAVLLDVLEGVVVGVLRVAGRAHGDLSRIGDDAQHLHGRVAGIRDALALGRDRGAPGRVIHDVGRDASLAEVADALDLGVDQAREAGGGVVVQVFVLRGGADVELVAAVGVGSLGHGGVLAG